MLKETVTKYVEDFPATENARLFICVRIPHVSRSSSCNRVLNLLAGLLGWCSIRRLYAPTTRFPPICTSTLHIDNIPRRPLSANRAVEVGFLLSLGGGAGAGSGVGESARRV